jgi:hypothetical protein
MRREVEVWTAAGSGIIAWDCESCSLADIERLTRTGPL